MAAAAELGLAGLSVALVEQSDRIGGFIDSGEETLPGYIHDVYSSWHPLFVSGGAYATLGKQLHGHGLSTATPMGRCRKHRSRGRSRCLPRPGSDGC